MNVWKKFSIAFAFAVLGLVIGWNLPRVAPIPLQNTREFPTGTVATSSSLLVDFGDGRVVTYAGLPISVGETVEEMMVEISHSRGLTIGWKEYGPGMGKLVTALDTVANDAQAGRFWSYWVNQHFAQVGVSTYRLTPGDQVMWKYTTDQFRAETR